MGRNEIRLRRQQMSTGRIARHRNYSELMRQHDRDVKLKRVLRVFTYLLIALFLVIILVIVIRWEKRSSQKSTHTIEVQETKECRDFVIAVGLGEYKTPDLWNPRKILTKMCTGIPSISF